MPSKLTCSLIVALVLALVLGAATASAGPDEAKLIVPITMPRFVIGQEEYSGSRAQAHQRYLLAWMAYLNGDFAKAGFLFMDAGLLSRPVYSIDEGADTADEIEVADESAAFSFLLSGEFDRVEPLLRSRRRVPVDFWNRLSKYPDTDPRRFSVVRGLGDERCGDETMVESIAIAIDLPRRYTPRDMVMPERYKAAAAAYRSRDFENAGAAFMAAAEGLSEGKAAVCYYCAALAYRQAETTDAVRGFCDRIRRIGNIWTGQVLTHSILLLDGWSDRKVRDICKGYGPESTPPASDCGLYNVSKYYGELLGAAEDFGAIQDAAWELMNVGDLKGAGTLLMAMGMFTILDPGSNGWHSQGLSDCWPTDCLSAKETLARGWIVNASDCFTKARDLFFAHRIVSRYARSVPAITKILGPSYFQVIFAHTSDPNRSLIRDGIDLEALSLTRNPLILYGNFPSLESEFFPKRSNTKMAERHFESGRRNFQKIRYEKAASEFFKAAVALKIECEDDFCRDALWVWRSHAVWNAVTSLRQLKDPEKACQEAKKFVELAGDGHQKSAAADVEDALCQNVDLDGVTGDDK